MAADRMGQRLGGPLPDAQPRQGQVVSTNLTWSASKVTAQERSELLAQTPATIWLTGLSGSGKSTIACELERQLVLSGHAAYVLDGDNIRFGLCRDLGFAPKDRTENIRRIAEVCKLFNDAGLLVITAFISPYRADRAMAREIIGAGRFAEIYLASSLEVCETRDPKGLYKKARTGEIRNFTGISAPYEAPLAPSLVLDTQALSIADSVAEILQVAERRFV